MRVLVASGGTGGHIIPAYALSEYLKNRNIHVSYITDERFFKYNLDIQDSISSLHVLKIKNTYKSKFIHLFSVLSSVKETIKVIKKDKIDIIIGFGSYVSLVAIIAGFLCRKKLFIHEQNKHIGLANLISSFFVNKIFLTFDDLKGFPNQKHIRKFLETKTVKTGMPVRNEIKMVSKMPIAPRDPVLNSYLGFDRINIFITGGSQGASFFDEKITKSILSLPKNIKDKLFVTQQAAIQNIDEIYHLYNQNGVNCRLDTFFQNPATIMSSSHIIISRAGASSINELACIACVAILIPLPNSKNNHQYLNAIHMKKSHGCCIVKEENFSTYNMSQIIANLIQNPVKMSEMAFNIHQFFISNSEEIILREIKKVVF